MRPRIGRDLHCLFAPSVALISAGGNRLGPEHHKREGPTGRRLFSLSLLALGIVYGDIGTSPLYAMRECFYGAHPVALTHPNVLGVLSLIFWSLVVVVMVKYHIYMLRSDNRGEGGIL